MKKHLLFLLALCSLNIGFSQTFIDNNITYTVTSTSPNEVAVTNYNINGGLNVVIPETVTPNSSSKITTTKNASNLMVTYTVTSIGNQAFFNKTITTVSIPNSVISIGSEAFADNSITSVQIGSGVQTIGFRAFGNNQLTSISLPDSVTNIDLRAFETNSITSVTIPLNVTSIGIAAFRYNPISCVNSKATTPPNIFTDNSINDTFNADRSGIELSIPSGTTAVYTTDAGALWTGFGSVNEITGSSFTVDNITYQINATATNEVTVTNYNIAGGTSVNIPATVSRACIPYTVTRIGNFAMDNIGLTSVTLPNTLVHIGENAFAFNDLPSIVIPDSVLTIDDGAFVQNNNMTSATIGTGVTSIGGFAFRFNALTSVVIPDNVLTIGDRAFESNSNITSVTIGSGLTTIGNYLFAYNSISSVTIPNNITTIGDFAFNNNTITTLTISNNVTSIGGFAFSTNQLATVTIPENVTSIGDHAFQNNPLTDVYSLNTTPPTIITGGTLDTFSTNRGTIDLHIPVGTTGPYVTDLGALWTDFNSVTEDASLSTTDFELTHGIKIITRPYAINIISSNTVILKQYTLYTITGAQLSAGTEPHIPTATLAKGVYIITLHFNTGTLSKKIII